MLVRTVLGVIALLLGGCAVAPDAVRRMDATRIQEISDYRLCDAAAVNLDLRGQRYPVIDAEIARRRVSCDEHIAAVVSNCSALEVLNWGNDGTGQGIIFTVRNQSGEAQNFRIRHDDQGSRMFTIGPATTERFGMTADPNVERLEEPVETNEGDGGIELQECRPALANYRFNYRPQGQGSSGATMAEAPAPQTRSTQQGVTSRATRNANMRAGPGTSFPVVGLLRAGEQVLVIGTSAGWCEGMASGGRRVFVSCSLLVPPPGGWGPLSLGAGPGSPASAAPMQAASSVDISSPLRFSTNPECNFSPQLNTMFSQLNSRNVSSARRSVTIGGMQLRPVARERGVRGSDSHRVSSSLSFPRPVTWNGLRVSLLTGGRGYEVNGYGFVFAERPVRVQQSLRGMGIEIPVGRMGRQIPTNSCNATVTLQQTPRGTELICEVGC
jgi:hypothetical protein